MILLSQVDVSKLVKGRRLKKAFYPAESDRQIFSEISSEDLRRLKSALNPVDPDKAREFLSELFDFKDRYLGELGGTAEYYLQQALYTLVYLAKNSSVIRLFVDAYVPLITSSPWDQTMKHRIAHTFMGDVYHLVYDIEHLEPAGDHEPFDWFGNLNAVRSDDRALLLRGSGCAPLRHPGFPPQHVWISHTNLQPLGNETTYRQALRSYYRDLGYPG